MPEETQTCNERVIKVSETVNTKHTTVTLLTEWSHIVNGLHPGQSIDCLV